jgi:hypothetical protein
MSESFTVMRDSFVQKTGLGCLVTGPGHIFWPEPTSPVPLTEVDDHASPDRQPFAKTRVHGGSSLMGLFFDAEESDSFRDELSISEVRRHTLLRPQKYIDRMCGDHEARKWMSERLCVGEQIYLVIGLITLKASVADAPGDPVPPILVGMSDSPPTEPSTAPRVWDAGAARGRPVWGEIWYHEGERVIGIKYRPFTPAIETRCAVCGSMFEEEDFTEGDSELSEFVDDIF